MPQFSDYDNDFYSRRPRQPAQRLPAPATPAPAAPTAQQGQPGAGQSGSTAAQIRQSGQGQSEDYARFSDAELNDWTSRWPYNPETGKFTSHGTHRNAATGHIVFSRGIADVSDPDRHVYRTYETGPDGQERQSFEGIFNRK